MNYSGGQSKYPTFIIAKGTAHPEWCETVERVIRNISFEDRRYFTESHSRFFQLHKTHGYDRAMKMLKDVAGDTAAYAAFNFAAPTIVGEAFFKMMSSSDWKLFPHGRETGKPLPVHDVQIMPSEKEFLVIPNSLKRTRLGYCSNRNITTVIDGHQRTVSFGYHAIERVYQRIVGYMGLYGSWGDVYAFFDQCQYFEEVRMTDGGRSLSIFQDCFLELMNPTTWCHPCQYAIEVIGIEAYALFKSHGIRWYYRVGYSPMFIDTNEIHLKTLLPPGYSKTPENGALKSAQLSTVERREFQCQKGDWTIEKLQTNKNFGVFKWFHDNGVPQVLPIEGDVFVPVDLDDAKQSKPPRVMRIAKNQEKL